MKGFTISISAGLISLVLFVFGCYPNKKVTTVNPGILKPSEFISTPAKVFMKDSSVVLFNDGFMIKADSLEGIGERHWMNLSFTDGNQILHIDSIATISYYEKEHTTGMVVGTAIMGITGAYLAPLSIHCLNCPKCCFGSCPTVYTTDGSDYGLEAELFSYSLSRFYQETDVDRLIQNSDPDGSYSLRLTNEALETHYINQFNLIAVRHPPGTDVYPGPDGRVVSVRSQKTPETATNSLGENVRPIIEKKDDLWHMGDTTRIDKVQSVFERDWLDLTLRPPENAKMIKLILRVRNTLLSTVLFYDLVLASQGVKALEWTQRINTDPVYAALYHMAYNNFAGMEVSVNLEGDWEKVGRFGDVGPIAWKELVIELPVTVDEENLMRIRLEWFPDNFMIDYIAYDTEIESDHDSIHTDLIHPRDITNFLGEDDSDLYSKIREDDSDFLITYPGDFYNFEYDVPQHEDLSTTLFIKSKGYYTEWLRGDWIAYRESGYQFNLFEPDETLEQLKRSWKENRALLEKTFFETKIPLKGGI
jgi:hypothetical protein